LRQLGHDRQVLCVTHLPQVAALGEHHWRVKKVSEKGMTTSNIDVLEPAERVDEIARMLGGVELTDTTRAHAREMLAAG
jgi:DNA repair protein RecN (Recombination protein N)